jgi:hypothetical protein
MRLIFIFLKSDLRDKSTCHSTFHYVMDVWLGKLHIYLISLRMQFEKQGCESQ